MQIWAKQGGQTGFFSSAPGKQRQREEKESKQTTIQAFPLCWTASLSNHHLLGRRFQTGKQPSIVFIQRLPQRESTVKSLQPGSSNSTALLNRYNAELFTQTQSPRTGFYSLLLNRSSCGISYTNRRYSVQQLVGQ